MGNEKKYVACLISDLLEEFGVSDRVSNVSFFPQDFVQIGGGTISNC